LSGWHSCCAGDEKTEICLHFDLAGAFQAGRLKSIKTVLGFVLPLNLGNK